MDELKHEELSKSRDRQFGSIGRRTIHMLVVSEYTRDGEVLIRRHVPSNEQREMGHNSYYLSLDSDDRVLVADTGNDRVILLDSDLKWNRILCSSKEDTEDTEIKKLSKLCYDKEMKQLIVLGNHMNEVNIYTLRRN